METILLVDDEPSIVSLAKIYLEREGFHTESVGDGLKALEVIARLRPGLLVLDVMLPGLDGFEVCRRLRRAGNEVPILMLTARDEDICVENVGSRRSYRNSYARQRRGYSTPGTAAHL